MLKWAPEYIYRIVLIACFIRLCILALFQSISLDGIIFLLLRRGRSRPKRFNRQTYHARRRAVSDDHENEV